jgi:V8-like Glu-specific endopeptidase
MTSRHVWHLGIVGLALTYLGCDGADTETHSLQQPSLTSSEGPQPDIVTPRGQRYRWVRKAVFTSPAKGTLSPIREVVHQIDPAREAADRQLPLAQFAEKLRARVLANGHEYLGDVDLELAERVRAAGPGRRREAYRPDATLPDSNGGPLGTQILGGSDERVIVRHNTLYPYRANVARDPGCSASTVGPSTMISAAHCFFDQGNWIATTSFIQGPDALDPAGTQFPYGTLGCYFLAFPAAFWDPNTDSGYDYAVIEYSWSPCNGYPGNVTGHYGAYAAPDSWITSTTARTKVVAGIPGEKSPWPQIWGMSSFTGFTVDANFVFYSVVDTTGGQSGCAVYAYDTDGFPYVFGIHLGGWGSTQNFAKRLNNGTIAWMEANSAW